MSMKVITGDYIEGRKGNMFAAAQLLLPQSAINEGYAPRPSFLSDYEGWIEEIINDDARISVHDAYEIAEDCMGEFDMNDVSHQRAAQMIELIGAINSIETVAMLTHPRWHGRENELVLTSEIQRVVRAVNFIHHRV